jgi:hypothetical protein
MAVYAHDVEDDVWDCELSDDDETSLFTALPPKLPPPKLPQAAPAAPAAASTAAPAPAPPAASSPRASSPASDSATSGGAGVGATEPGEAGSAGANSSRTELLVASGNTKQRRLKLIKGDQIGWNFREASGHRVDFSVFFVRVGMGPGEEIKVTPLSRCEAHAGTYVAKGSGELVLMFDNQFSWWTDKMVKFEVTRLRAEGADSASPPKAGGDDGIHVGAAGVRAHSGGQEQDSSASSSGAENVEAGAAATEQPTASETPQQDASGSEDSRAAKAKRQWEAEAAEARARWQEQAKAESADEQEEDDDDSDDDDDDEQESSDRGEPDQGEEGSAQGGLDGQEPPRDRASALRMIEEGKAAEAAGDQATAVELFETALTALVALGESRPKLVARIEGLRKRLEAAAGVKAEGDGSGEPDGFQYAAQI